MAKLSRAERRARRRAQHQQRRMQRWQRRIFRDRPGKYVIVRDELGDPCPRCGEPTQVGTHDGLTAKQLKQSVVYAKWFYCVNLRCQTTTIVPERFKIVHPRVEPEPS